MRRPALLLVAAAAFPAATAAQGPEEAAARQQAQVRALVAQSCPLGNGNEVVVCGRREPVQRYRAPLPELAATRTPERAGDAQLTALATDAGRCSPAIRDQQCGGGLDVIGIGFTVARAVVQALANGD